jgi:hypothetical protein
LETNYKSSYNCTHRQAIRLKYLKLPSMTHACNGGQILRY